MSQPSTTVEQSTGSLRVKNLIPFPGVAIAIHNQQESASTLPLENPVVFQKPSPISLGVPMNSASGTGTNTNGEESESEGEGEVPKMDQNKGKISNEEFPPFPTENEDIGPTSNAFGSSFRDNARELIINKPNPPVSSSQYPHASGAGGNPTHHQVGKSDSIGATSIRGNMTTFRMGRSQQNPKSRVKDQRNQDTRRLIFGGTK